MIHRLPFLRISDMPAGPVAPRRAPLFSRHERGGAGGGRVRMFESGALRLLMLRLIGDAPRHGYDIIKSLEDRFGGLYSPSPGVVYPTLQLLEDQGLIAPAQDAGQRRCFAITPEGRLCLADNRARIAALDARFAERDAPRDGDGMSDRDAFRIALSRLKTAVVTQVGSGPLDASRAERIKEILAQAADEIERL
jgi:DNA-binding PadR family transcriptional regulator